MSHPDKQWAETAVNRELDVIAKLGEERANKPDSKWWKSVIRIASVVKGSGKAHMAPGRVREAIHRATPHHVYFKPDRDRGIDYLFGRAMNRASPRYRAPKCGDG